MHGQRSLQVAVQGLTKEWDMTKWLKNNWCMTSIHKYLLHKWTKDYFNFQQCKVIFIPLDEFISRIWRAWLLSFFFFFWTYILFLWISVFSSKSKKLKSKFLTNASPDLSEGRSAVSDSLQSHGLARILEWRPFPSTEDFLNPGIEPRSPALHLDSLSAEPQGKPWNTGVDSLSLPQWIFPTQDWTRLDSLPTELSGKPDN